MVTFSTRPKRLNSSSKSRSRVRMLKPKTPSTLEGLGAYKKGSETRHEWNKGCSQLGSAWEEEATCDEEVGFGSLFRHGRRGLCHDRCPYPWCCHWHLRGFCQQGYASETCHVPHLRQQQLEARCMRRNKGRLQCFRCFQRTTSSLSIFLRAVAAAVDDSPWWFRIRSCLHLFAPILVDVLHRQL
jgi:hypothetical protein